MAEEVLSFSWEVSTGGHRIVSILVEGRGQVRFVTDGVPVGEKFAVRRYQPLKEHTGLSREFADLELSPEAVVTFADKYGLLGEWTEITVPADVNGKLTELRCAGEPLSHWFNEIRAMKRAVELYDMLQRRDVNGLSTRIYWRSKTEVFYCDHPNGPEGVQKDRGIPEGWALHQIASKDVNSFLLDRFKYPDLVMPAWYYVQWVTNKHLENRATPKLLWARKGSRLSLYWEPTSLIGAIWLQFAQTVDGRKEHRRCEECRTWFEVSPLTARTSRVYCSNACRVRAYRGRIAKARELYTAGLGIEEIAEKVGSDPETVRGWLSQFA